MINLTKHQEEMISRMKEDIEAETFMCDGHADLILLASLLYGKAKHIFTVYANTFGPDELEKVMAEATQSLAK